jgi:hypothetical protein
MQHRGGPTGAEERVLADCVAGECDGVPNRTQIFPLAEAAEAHRRAENGSLGGRILLAP